MWRGQDKNVSFRASRPSENRDLLVKVRSWLATIFLFQFPRSIKWNQMKKIFILIVEVDLTSCLAVWVALIVFIDKWTLSHSSLLPSQVSSSRNSLHEILFFVYSVNSTYGRQKSTWRVRNLRKSEGKKALNKFVGRKKSFSCLFIGEASDKEKKHFAIKRKKSLMAVNGLNSFCVQRRLWENEVEKGSELIFTSRGVTS